MKKNRPKPFLSVKPRKSFFILVDEDNVIYNVSKTFKQAKACIPTIARKLKKERFRRKKLHWLFPKHRVTSNY